MTDLSDHRVAAATKRREATDGRAFLAIAVVVSFYTVVNAADIRLAAPARFVYVLFLATIGVFLLAGLAHRGKTAEVPHTLVFWSTLMFVQLVQVPVLASGTVNRAVTDFLVTVSFLGVFLVIRLWPPSGRQVTVGLIGVSVASFAATMYAWQLSGNGARFEAPAIVGIVGAWVFAIVPIPHNLMRPHATLWTRRLARLAVLALVPAILASRSRTALLVWLMAGLLCWTLPGLRRPSRTLAVIVTAVVFATAWTALGDKITQSTRFPAVLEQARIDSILSGDLDASSQARIGEIYDVRNTMRDEGGPLEHLVGFGHGASYKPSRIYNERNVDATTGRVHQIHATPYAVWFRYGLIGLFLFVALILSVVLTAIRNYRRSRSLLSVMLLVMLVMYIVDMLFRNSMVDPVFALAVALTFAGAGQRLRAVT